jgi:hypothetical protein
MAGGGSLLAYNFRVLNTFISGVSFDRLHLAWEICPPHTYERLFQSII